MIVADPYYVLKLNSKKEQRKKERISSVTARLFFATRLGHEWNAMGVEVIVGMSDEADYFIAPCSFFD